MLCPSCQAENEDGAPICFSCRTILSVVTRGTLIAGRYEILSPLGKGGMGAVYKARDRTLDEVVALKLLRADVAGTPQMAERFRSEIRLARSVSHWNVCRIHEYGEDDGRQYISMELVEGRSLKALLEAGPLPAARSFDLALQAVEGLQAIHKVGIVHRDLKSLNIMVDAADVLRLMDFGIAKRIGPGGDPRASGYVMGTPEYMSPEQARGRRVDFRSDVYAMGIVIYEMFTGRVPFHGDTPVATLLLHLEGTPSFEGPEAGAIPPPLVPVLRKALAKTADERYASAAELAAALRAARDETLGTQGRSERSPTRVLPRPRSRAVPAGLAGLGVVAVAVAVFLWQREPAATATPAPPPSLAARPPLPSPTSFPQAASPAESAPSSLASERVTLKPAARASPQPVVDSTTPAAMPPPRVEATPTPPIPEPAAPTPSAPPAAQVAAASPPPEAGGGLRIVVEPWAEVSVDGHPMGQTPLNRLALAAGRHDVLLTNPAYEPVQRKVTIRPGETLRLYVDLETDGVRRRR